MSNPLLAAHLASKGRGGDDQLVHMSSDEMRALSQMTNRKFTINPDTGLPEAFGFGDILSTAAPIALAAFAPELIPALGPEAMGGGMMGSILSGMAVGAGVGGLSSMLSGGNLGKGIIRGGLFGGLGGGLSNGLGLQGTSGAGADAETQAAAANAANADAGIANQVANTPTQIADLSGGYQIPVTTAGGAYSPSAVDQVGTVAGRASPESNPNLYYADKAPPGPGEVNVKSAVDTSGYQNARPSLGSQTSNFYKEYKTPILLGGLGLALSSDTPEQAPLPTMASTQQHIPTATASPIARTYTPYAGNLNTYGQGQGEYNYFSNNAMPKVTYAAKGGRVKGIGTPRYAEGGATDAAPSMNSREANVGGRMVYYDRAGNVEAYENKLRQLVPGPAAKPSVLPSYYFPEDMASRRSHLRPTDTPSDLPTPFARGGRVKLAGGGLSAIQSGMGILSPGQLQSTSSQATSSLQTPYQGTAPAQVTARANAANTPKSGLSSILSKEAATASGLDQALMAKLKAEQDAEYGGGTGAALPYTTTAGQSQPQIQQQAAPPSREQQALASIQYPWQLEQAFNPASKTPMAQAYTQGINSSMLGPTAANNPPASNQPIQGLEDAYQRQLMSQGLAMKKGGSVVEAARLVASKGAGHDTLLAHINPKEASVLRSMGGRGIVNPKTGLPGFDGGDDSEGDTGGPSESDNSPPGPDNSPPGPGPGGPGGPPGPDNSPPGPGPGGPGGPSGPDGVDGHGVDTPDSAPPDTNITAPVDTAQAPPVDPTASSLSEIASTSVNNSPLTTTDYNQLAVEKINQDPNPNNLTEQMPVQPQSWLDAHTPSWQDIAKIGVNALFPTVATAVAGPLGAMLGMGNSASAVFGGPSVGNSLVSNASQNATAGTNVATDFGIPSVNPATGNTGSGQSNSILSAAYRPQASSPLSMNLNSGLYGNFARGGRVSLADGGNKGVMLSPQDEKALIANWVSGPGTDPSTLDINALKQAEKRLETLGTRYRQVLPPDHVLQGRPEMPPPKPEFASGGPLTMAAGGRFNEGRELYMVDGGALHGNTDGQADEVPAQLSHGEYVIDAATVALLGGGNNAAGAKKLDEMRAKIRKRSTGSTKQPKQVKASPLSMM